MSPEALVHAASLRKVHGAGDAAVTALADATFTVSRGDQIALVGPSGSGKSTLLHLMAGLDIPSGGTIEWPAIGPITALRPGSVSFAFQGPSLLPPLTVLENVALPLLLAGEGEAAAASTAREMLLRFHIGNIADKLPEEISGGQSQRAGLARAIVGQPRLVLADEPTGQLDHETAALVMAGLLATLDDVGAATVVATHDLSVAAVFPVRWTISAGTLTTEAAPSLV
ncbi:MAG: ATP-binding cassette domain-containing protein [Actinobacteria bacterium]|nr:ATP-binding cassette domain-containing protein [Actinomycetota bacterium]